MNGTLTKADIIDAIYTVSSRKRHEVKIIVDQLITLMSETLRKDHELLLSGLGKFECYAKQERRGRNPKTSEMMMLPARVVVVFRLSRVFREQLNP